MEYQDLKGVPMVGGKLVDGVSHTSDSKMVVIGIGGVSGMGWVNVLGRSGKGFEQLVVNFVSDKGGG